MSLAINSNQKLIVIDPGMQRPEIGCLNKISDLYSGQVYYHLPVISGLHTLDEQTDSLENIKGCIVLGSAASVNDNLPWQKKLEKFLALCFETNIPVLGICYGHQLLAAMMGGSVSWVYTDQRKTVGLKMISPIKSNFWRNDLSSFNVWVSHKEEVKTLPATAISIAEREGCLYEGLSYPKFKAWSFQSHPEATYDFILQNKSSLSAIDLNKINLETGYKIIKNFFHVHTP